jgi:hypothetical protein
VTAERNVSTVTESHQNRFTTLVLKIQICRVLDIIYYYLIKFNVRIEPLGYGRLIIHVFVSLVASLRSTFIHGLKARAFGMLQAAVRIHLPSPNALSRSGSIIAT